VVRTAAAHLFLAVTARHHGCGAHRRRRLPLSKPALATVGLFVMLLYWNDWWLGLLYITDDRLVPVQLYLYRILTNIDYAASNSHLAGTTAAIPIQTVRMAVAVLAIGPIVTAFFFIQRFLVRGITLGGIKD
jgi:putative aldouronate transport system permease protein